MCSVTFLWVQYTKKSEKKEQTRRQKVRTFLPGIPDSWSHWRRHFRSAHFCPDLFSQQLWGNFEATVWHKFNTFMTKLWRRHPGRLTFVRTCFISAQSVSHCFPKWPSCICLIDFAWLFLYKELGFVILSPRGRHKNLSSVVLCMYILPLPWVFLTEKLYLTLYFCLSIHHIP